MKTLIFGLAFAIIAGIIGFMGYGLFYYHGAYELRTSELQRSYATLNEKSLRYGVIKSIGTSTRMVEINSVSSYKMGESLTLSLTIAPEAFIGHQELLSSDGTITGLSSTTRASSDLSKLTPGTRVKFLVNYTTNPAQISYLLFGYPL